MGKLIVNIQDGAWIFYPSLSPKTVRMALPVKAHSLTASLLLKHLLFHLVLDRLSSDSMPSKCT